MPDVVEADAPIAQGPDPVDWRLARGEFGNGATLCLELRPAAGSWKPFVFGVPAAERALVVSLLPGKAGVPPEGALVSNPRAGATDDGTLWCWRMDNAATRTQSYFAYLSALPSLIVLGQADGGPQYQLDVREIAGEDPDDDPA